MTSQFGQLHFGQGVGVNMPFEASDCVRVLRGIATASLLDGFELLFNSTAGLYQSDEPLSLFLGRGKSVTPRDSSEIAERFQTITAVVLIICSSDPGSDALTSGWAVTQEATWPNALPMRFAL